MLVACFSDFVAPEVKAGVSVALSAPPADLISNIEFMVVDFWYSLDMGPSAGGASLRQKMSGAMARNSPS